MNPEKGPRPEDKKQEPKLASEILQEGREALKPLKDRLQEVKEQIKNLAIEHLNAKLQKGPVEEIEESMETLEAEKDLLIIQIERIEEQTKEKVKNNADNGM